MDGVRQPGGGDDAPGFGEGYSRLEHPQLLHRYGVDVTGVVQGRDERSHAVVAQSTGLDAQDVHLDDWGIQELLLVYQIKPVKQKAKSGIIVA